MCANWGLDEEEGKGISRSESQSQASKLDVLVQKIVKKTGKSVLEVHLFKRNEKRSLLELLDGCWGFCSGREDVCGFV